MTENTGLPLTASQEDAIVRIESLLDGREHMILLAGPAGTGKTTLLWHLVRRLDEQARDVAVVTPTNKAAKVLRAKGVTDAATLYRIFFTPDDEIGSGPAPAAVARLEQRLGRAATQEELDELPREKRRRAAGPKASLRFTPNCDIPLSVDADTGEMVRKLAPGKLDFCDVIVVDEASMLTTWTLKQLARMCNTLVLVGDPHQLPPVNDKTNPNGFFCTARPDVELTEVLRQAADTEGRKILRLATLIRENKHDPAHFRHFMPQTTFPGWFKADRKVVAFTNANRRTVNHAARAALGFSGLLPQPGEVLVSTANTSDVLLNGTEVTVVSCTWTGDPAKPARVTVVTDADETVETDLLLGPFFSDQPDWVFSAEEWLSVEKVIQLYRIGLSATDRADDDAEGLQATYGYCLTAHKAQGSEWDDVCVIDESYILRKVASEGDTERRWFYTAVTRASRRLVVADIRWIRGSLSRRAA